MEDIARPLALCAWCEVLALLFDNFGTVVDWRIGVPRQAAAFAATQGQDLDVEAFADGS